MRIKTIILTILLTAISFFNHQLQAQDEPDIDTFIVVDVPPNPINMTEVKTAIGYPQAAIDSNVSGVVVVRILVDEEGNYVKHKIIKSPSPLLSDAVEANIGSLTFSPAMLGTEKLKFWVNVPFHFRLQEPSRDDASYIEGVVEAYTKKIEEKPEDYTLYLQRGVQYSNAGNYEKALEDFNKSIELNPQKNRKKSRDYFYLFFTQMHRGKLYNAQGEWELARANFNAAIQTYNDIKVMDTLMEQVLYNVYLERGVALERLEMYTEALEDYDVAIQNSEENACLIQGFKYDLALSKKDYALVVRCLDELIACEPPSDTYTLHYNRGYYQIKIEEYEQALADLDTVVMLSSNIYLKLGAINQKAEAYRLMGQTEQALAEVKKAMDINLLHPSAYFSKGKILNDMGKKEEACTSFEKAVVYGLGGEDLAELEKLQKEMCNP